MANERFAIGRPETDVSGGGKSDAARDLIVGFHVIAPGSSSTSTPEKLFEYTRAPAITTLASNKTVRRESLVSARARFVGLVSGPAFRRGTVQLYAGLCVFSDVVRL
jgi:hypothetical protein